jgi:4'-phosphopantetheinyl transferase
VTLQVWLSDVDEVDLAPAQGTFSAEELARAEQIGSARLRRRFLARRWMARTLLGRATGEEPAALVIESRCERCGRLHPASQLAGESGEVWWSSSSSASLAAVALSPWRVGIDIEQRRERPRWERIAKRFYTEDEQRAVAGSADRFLEFWTLKEAYLKAIGIGLPGGLRSFDCSGLSRSLGEWLEGTAHPGWRFRQLDAAAGTVAAVAVEGTPDRIELRRWAPDAGEAR